MPLQIPSTFCRVIDDAVLFKTSICKFTFVIGNLPGVGLPKRVLKALSIPELQQHSGVSQIVVGLEGTVTLKVMNIILHIDTKMYQLGFVVLKLLLRHL